MVYFHTRYTVYLSAYIMLSGVNQPRVTLGRKFKIPPASYFSELVWYRRPDVSNIVHNKTLYLSNSLIFTLNPK